MEVILFFFTLFIFILALATAGLGIDANMREHRNSCGEDKGIEAPYYEMIDGKKFLVLEDDRGEIWVFGEDEYKGKRKQYLIDKYQKNGKKKCQK